ncbi:MAG TPA: 8-amino-7-oxononanoate synthase [Burkholderiales bacterium]|nr:8-amino-7-oxononanoate synthase [Burkholderiales bacterium]
MRDIEANLREFERRDLLRVRRTVESSSGARMTVDGGERLAFCNNDYLGLSKHPALIDALKSGADRYGAGAGASALISGHTAVHEQLEERLAAFVRMPRALHFSTGYMANLAVLPALASAGDTIFADSLNHASLIDAGRLARAEVVEYPHCDVSFLEERLAECKSEGKIVVTDAVFSMDGDIAPLPTLLALCERFNATLIVDDAHGFGILGSEGRGALAHCNLSSPRLVYIGTLGKAAGVAGAFVAAEEAVIEWLIQRGRTYVYTTAPPPALSAALLASIDLIGSSEGEARRACLRSHIARLRSGLSGLRWSLLESDTAIQPLLIGSNKMTLDLMHRLYDCGIWVPAIRPPTVPQGSSRLRISLSAAHSEADIDQLTDALHDCASQLAA